MFFFPKYPSRLRVLKNNRDFLTSFSQTGETWIVSQQHEGGLETVACLLCLKIKQKGGGKSMYIQQKEPGEVGLVFLKSRLCFSFLSVSCNPSYRPPPPPYFNKMLSCILFSVCIIFSSGWIQMTPSQRMVNMDRAKGLKERGNQLHSIGRLNSGLTAAYLHRVKVGDERLHFFCPDLLYN